MQPIKRCVGKALGVPSARRNRPFAEAMRLLPGPKAGTPIVDRGKAGTGMAGLPGEHAIFVRADEARGAGAWGAGCRSVRSVTAGGEAAIGIADLLQDRMRIVSGRKTDRVMLPERPCACAVQDARDRVGSNDGNRPVEPGGHPG